MFNKEYSINVNMEDVMELREALSMQHFIVEMLSQAESKNRAMVSKLRDIEFTFGHIMDKIADAIDEEENQNGSES